MLHQKRITHRSWYWMGCISRMTSTYLDFSTQDRYWLEAFRWRLAVDFKGLGLHPTSKQVATLAERSNHLRCCIANWIEVQERYMLEVRLSRQWDARGKPDGIAPFKPQEILLYLPSSYKISNTPPTTRAPYLWAATQRRACTQRTAWDASTPSRSHSSLPTKGQICAGCPAQHLRQFGD